MTPRLEELARTAATLVGLCAIAAVGSTASCFSDRASGVSLVCETSPCVVDIQDLAFRPAELRIRTGTTVRWVNREQQAGLGHTSTSDNALWDSPVLAPGESFSHTFTSAGRFPYHCEPHPTMRAAIVVE
jgi:plastocyanin